jgi:hypothetical protein
MRVGRKNDPGQNEKQRDVDLRHFIGISAFLDDLDR